MIAHANSSVFSSHVDPLQAARGIFSAVFFAAVVWGLVVAACLCL